MSVDVTQVTPRAVQLSSALAALADLVSHSVVVVRGGPGSAGSGVVWDSPGLVITNHHVVPGPTAQVVLDHERSLPARVVLRAPRLDLVALELQGDLEVSRRAVIGDSARLRVGALANARGEVVGIPHMVAGRGLALAVPSAIVQRFLAEPSHADLTWV